MLALCAAWGLQSVAIKVAVAEVPPVLQAAIRSLGAGLLVWLWARTRRTRLFTSDGTLWAGIGAGTLFGVEFVFLYWGLEYTTASRGVLFLYTAPFVVALGVHLLIPGERLNRWQGFGLVCAFVGVVAAFSDGLRMPTASQMIGDAMILVAAVLWGATTVLIKTSSLARAPAVKTLLYQLVVSALILPVASLGLGESWAVLSGAIPVSGLAVAGIAYQTIGVAFVTYLTWFWLITKYPAGRLAAFSFLTPLFGMLAGGLLLGEPLTPGLLVAGVLVAVGIRLVNNPPKRRP
ncbi:MAG: DMT family transporter [Rhodospirillaceae bacterium]